MSDTASVLDDDQEKTPIDEELPLCDVCNTSQKNLGLHKWQAHRIKKGETSAPAKTSAPKPKASTVRKKDLRGKLEASIGVVGVGVGLLDRYDGAVIHNGAPALATALADWADQDEKARKYIEMLAFDAPWIGVVMILLSMGFPIAAHHGAVKTVPAMFSGFVPRDATAAEKAPKTGSTVPDVSGAPQMDLGAMMQDPGFQSFLQGVAGGSGFAKPFGAAEPESPVKKIVVP